MKIIRANQIEVNHWSGGTTSELFIYPEDAEFSENNYQLRISIATVEQMRTVFTPLANTSRTLLVLEGHQLLEHENHHTADLSSEQQDSFSGDWTTRCTGLSTNFNVMYRPDARVSVNVLQYPAGSEISFTSDALHFIYVLEGRLKTTNGFMNPKDAACLHGAVTFSISHNVKMIRVKYAPKPVL